MRRLIPLLALTVASGAEAQDLSLHATTLVGGTYTTRDTILPVSPTISVVAIAQLNVPPYQYLSGISPFFGVGATFAPVNETTDLYALGQLGLLMDAPGQPRIFGLGGFAWPTKELTWNTALKKWEGGDGYVLGGGMSFLVGKVMAEWRYLNDQRFMGSDRSTVTMLVGWRY